MTDAGRISIGVFGVLGDTILTSAIVKYKIVPGAIIQETEDVTPELWDQILQAYQSIAGTVSDLADIQAAFINNASQVIRQVEDALRSILFKSPPLIPRYTARRLGKGRQTDKQKGDQQRPPAHRISRNEMANPPPRAMRRVYCLEASTVSRVMV